MKDAINRLAAAIERHNVLQEESAVQAAVLLKTMDANRDDNEQARAEAQQQHEDFLKHWKEGR